MKPDVYNHLIYNINSTHGHLADLLYWIPTINLKQRKEIVRLARSREDPEYGTLQMQLLSKSLSYNDIFQISTSFDTPVLRSLLLHCARNSPMIDTDMREQLTSSAMKEINVMDSTPRKPSINWSPFFGHYDEQIHPSIPTNESMAQEVHNAIDNWVRYCKDTIFYPKLSTKTMSHSTLISAQKLISDINPEQELTQVDAEYLYHTTGIKIEGHSEMRQKYYHSQLDPRTYFASGGSEFFLSKDIAKSWAVLCDFLEPCNRSLRTNPNRLTVPDNGYGLIYDLTSFTSNLHEHASFLYSLSNYCKYVPIRFMDATRGIIERDLKDLVYDEMLTVSLPKYETKRGMIVYSSGEHNVAGMLGVYGNIATATFIHAAVVLQTHQSTKELNIAGDDGLSCTTKSRENLVIDSIQLLGTLEQSKVYRTTEPGCLHLKKTIKQIGNKFVTYSNIVMPCEEYQLQDFNIDPRYPYFTSMTKRERKGSVASSLFGSLSSLMHQPITDTERVMMYNIYKSLYRKNGFPLDGNVPQSGNTELPFIPMLRLESIGLDPLTYTIANFSTLYAKLPVRKKVSWNSDVLFGYADFEANSNANLSYIERLGYVEKEVIYQVVFGSDVKQALLEEYTTITQNLYLYRILNKVPHHLIT